MLVGILIFSIIVCSLAYRHYGGFLSKHCQLDDTRVTPATEINDGVDFVPTKASIVFGHHFSSIAGAGPIVGPIMAAMYFGWGPTWIWILIGSIFVGGVHDFGSTLMSVRSGGKSIAETTCSLVGSKTGKLFMLFVALALIYVIIVFLDLTAKTFSETPAVATSSIWFVITAVIYGRMIFRSRLSASVSTWIMIPITFVGLFIGHHFPFMKLDHNTWGYLILGYCFVAAILPVNVLLQPRDFLSSTFLYAILVIGLLGVIFSDAPIVLPFFKGFHPEDTAMLMPFLFITVACGACSGFHSIVSSGTTSKQIIKESDIRRVGYGAMLVEGVLAVFALACIAVLSPAETKGMHPLAIFSQGAGVFMQSLHIPLEFGKEFALLAISTFLLTTLDTCTRLTRFIFEELIGVKNQTTRYVGTLLAVVLPGLFAFQTFNGQPAWKAIWPMFGATNQLLAALALVTFVVYLKSKKLSYAFALIPAVVMIIMPMWALASKFLNGLSGPLLLPVLSGVMFVLGLFLVVMSFKYIFSKKEDSVL